MIGAVSESIVIFLQKSPPFGFLNESSKHSIKSLFFVILVGCVIFPLQPLPTGLQQTKTQASILPSAGQ